MEFYRIVDNQLIILDKKKEEIENATNRGTECNWCKYKGNCERVDVMRGGSGCDGMTCILEEV